MYTTFTGSHLRAVTDADDDDDDDDDDEDDDDNAGRHSTTTRNGRFSHTGFLWPILIGLSP